MVLRRSALVSPPSWECSGRMGPGPLGDGYKLGTSLFRRQARGRVDTHRNDSSGHLPTSLISVELFLARQRHMESRRDGIGPLALINYAPAPVTSPKTEVLFLKLSQDRGFREFRHPTTATTLIPSCIVHNKGGNHSAVVSFFFYRICCAVSTRPTNSPTFTRKHVSIGAERNE